MPATTDPEIARRLHRDTQRGVHKDCFACSLDNESGLQIHFTVLGDGRIKGMFDCDERYAGYAGQLQGGVITTLLDSAMTNCLFAAGTAAVTAELSTRFRHPVETGRPAELFAAIERRTHDLYLMTAELYQHGRLCATAKGKFVERPAG